jgi:NAD(P)-dependent dehydrogenase (short-subunit alcohol dehydrogenase family)
MAPQRGSMSIDDREAPLIFSQEDIRLFAQASHDVSPLHVSEAYARRTPFGRPVVHGGLAVLACLTRERGRAGRHLAALSAEFKGPLFTGIAYAVQRDARGSRTTVRLLDGSRVLLKLTADFEAGQSSSFPTTSTAARDRAAVRGLEDLPTGFRFDGFYGPKAEDVDAILARLGAVAESGVSGADAAILMAVSYIVGMEAPGERALLCAFRLTLSGAPTSSARPLVYRAKVEASDSRFGLVRFTTTFSLDDACLAVADVSAFVRDESKSLDAALLRARSSPSDSLAGKTAIVVGGSRGLGAALSLALADQGCTVGLTFAKTADAARCVAASAVPGRIELLQVDATDARHFATLAREFVQRHGGLDILVCNACPPLSSLTLDLASLARITDYVAQSVAMAAVPMAATLDLLDSRGGIVVVISSAAVTDPPTEWPHYAAAKGAVEGLARAAAARRRVRALIVRAPRLQTDLVNTPGVHPDARPPEIVAACTVRHLATSSAAPFAILEASDVDGSIS